MRLLVVEDEKKLCDMIAKSLHLAGYEVDMCNDGEQALDMIYAEMYDLIVLDLNLPGLDGMEILRELRKENEETKEYYLTFDSLRSNCRVTHQPDFGDMFLYYKSKKHITEKSLVKYLSSFRSEYHFHEECCEMIFKRLSDILNKGDKLLVCALYTRRGGIDICPSRWTKNCEIKDVEILNDITKFARGSIKQ